MTEPKKIYRYPGINAFKEAQNRIRYAVLTYANQIKNKAK